MNMDVLIYRILAEMGPMTISQISTELSCSNRSVRQPLDLLVNSGKVSATHSVKGGSYCVTYEAVA